MFPAPRDPLDRAVRAHLDSEGRAGDPERILTHVLNLLDQPRWRSASRRAFLMPLAAAAALLIALFAVSPRQSAQAGPAEIVRDARIVHERELDRCYLLQAEPSEGVRRRLPRFDFRHEALLWTRGNQFRVESRVDPKRPWSWGRDDRGDVWVAASPRLGLRFEADEIPEPLGTFVEIHTVRLPTLLSDVLRDCDLAFEKSSANLRVVRATLKKNAVGTLAEARVEIDAVTHVVRKLTLKRRIMGRDLATVTLTLVENAVQSDASYTLQGNLQPGFTLLDRSQPVQRNAKLLRLLGSMKP